MIRAMETPPKGIGKAALSEFVQYCDAVADHYLTNLAHIRPPTLLQILFAVSDPEILAADAPPAVDYLGTRSRKALSSFSVQMRDIYAKAHSSPVHVLLTYIIESLGLWKYFEKQSNSKDEMEERKANVRELQNAAQRYNTGGPSMQKTREFDPNNLGTEELSPLDTFLEDVALVTDMADESKRRASERRLVANLMTIHASKGERNKESRMYVCVGQTFGSLTVVVCPNKQAWSLIPYTWLEMKKGHCPLQTRIPMKRNDFVTVSRHGFM